MYVVNITRAFVNYASKYHRYHQSINQKFTGFSYKDGVVTLNYNAPLSEAEQSAIQVADVAFVDNDPIEFIRLNAVQPARTFGETLLDEFSAENLLLGIVESGLKRSVRILLHDVVECIKLGDLTGAIEEARLIPSANYDPVFVNADRLLVYVNKIEDYLGMERSETL